MKTQFTNELRSGVRVHTTFLVQSKEQKVAANGAPYLDLELRDARGVIKAKLWDCNRYDLDFETDDIVEVDGTAEEYKGTPQVRLRQIVRAKSSDYDPRDFFPRSTQDPEQMYADLLSRVQRVEDEHLRKLLLAILEDPAIAERYKLVPAAVSYHHAFLGGLLEHVLSLVQLGDRLCDHYPTLRRDLLIAGLVLHDLGKIEELSFASGFRYTTRGQLLGHIALGLQIVGEKIRALPDFPTSWQDQIDHIILSHHGKTEFGSPKEPCFPEALVVNFLDEMDSKLASMRAQYVTDQERPGDWTSRNPALRRELLKVGLNAPAATTPPEPADGKQKHPF